MQFCKTVIANGNFFELSDTLNIRALQTKLVSFWDGVCWYDPTQHQCNGKKNQINDLESSWKKRNIGRHSWTAFWTVKKEYLIINFDFISEKPCTSPVTNII